jgi:Outer membrane protein and related peptidoglycan-associated (lipo)proteins
MNTSVMVVAAVVLLPALGLAQSPFDALTKAAGDAGKAEMEKKVNEKLLQEARKNQCSFKSGTAELAPGCDAKLKKLTATLVDAKHQLDSAGVRSYKFEVSGHTDSSGDAGKNKALSEERAQTIVNELVARGIGKGEIIAVGRGSEAMLVKPDDTAAKKQKNRRYEIRVRV